MLSIRGKIGAFLALVVVVKCDDVAECTLPPDELLLLHGCSRSLLEDWLSPSFELKGYHAVCVPPPSSASQESATPILVFKNGTPSANPFTSVLGPLETMRIQDLDHQLAEATGAARHLDPWHDAGKFFQLCRNEHERCQEWATAGECVANPNYMLYSCGGSCGTCNLTNEQPMWSGQKWRVFETKTGMNNPVSVEDMLETGGLFLFFEGGQFIWPGVRIGFKRTISVSDARSGKGGLFTTSRGDTVARDTASSSTRHITLETLSLEPLVLGINDFLSKEECTHVIQEASPHMAHSKVAHMDKDKGKPDTEFRTSTNYFLPSRTPTLKQVDDRVASLTRVPRQHQEYVQVLRYEHQQHYGTHHDYWDPDYYQSPEWLDMTRGGFSNRLATVFWYMTDVERGGETNFPRAHGGPDLPNTNGNCATRGLSVTPKEGKVIVFYSLKPDGSGDTYSLHASCPVLEGTKWAANKWVWNVPKGFIQ